MSYSVGEILSLVKENDVQLIRMAFVDVFGALKNIAIMPRELPRAFESGISFDASSIRGFMNVSRSDLFLFPDPDTFSVLPWRGGRGRVIRFFCNIRHPNGEPFEGDGRRVLKNVAALAEKDGLQCKIGPECEFYLFELDEKGKPTLVPQDDAGYFDAAPPDKGENVRREICLTLDEMGIEPESSHHEQGPGQNEIDFKYSAPLRAADNLVAFKSVVRAVAAANGLCASFMPKPFEDMSGSGLHVNLSVEKNGVNLFEKQRGAFSAEAASFIAGILEKTPEMTAIFNPSANSYRRFGGFSAPRHISWSAENRSQLVRIPAASGAYSRMELRSPDPLCNPYYAFALLIAAGFQGIAEKKELPPPVDKDMYAEPKNGAGLPALPADLGEALALAESSAFIRRVLPEKTVRVLLDGGWEEWRAWRHAGDKMAFERGRCLSRP